MQTSKSGSRANQGAARLEGGESMFVGFKVPGCAIWFVVIVVLFLFLAAVAR